MIEKKPKQKMFVVKKYIMTVSASEALRKEKKIPADDCWVDEDWRKGNNKQLADAIGFEVTNNEDD